MTIDKEDSDEARPAGRGGSASPIEFRLDAGSGVPTYLQLVHQVEHALRLGYLKPGDQLPKVRDVVAELAINPNTVLKAYRDLEVKGLAAGRPGQGTFVQATLSQVALPELTALRRSLSGWRPRPRVRSPCSAADPPAPRPRWTASRSSHRTRRCTRTCPSRTCCT